MHGGQKKGMDPLLATQGVGPGGEIPPPVPPEVNFLHFVYVLRDKQEKDRNNLHVRAIAK